jgi:hypothetical protein
LTFTYEKKVPIDIRGRLDYGEQRYQFIHGHIYLTSINFVSVVLLPSIKEAAHVCKVKNICIGPTYMGPYVVLDVEITHTTIGIYLFVHKHK